MRRSPPHKPSSSLLHYRSRCKAFIERLLLTLMCGLITLFVFKGSFITTPTSELTPPDFVNSKIVTTMTGVSDSLSSKQQQQEELVKARKLRGGKEDAEDPDQTLSSSGTRNEAKEPHHTKKKIKKDHQQNSQKLESIKVNVSKSFSLGPKISDWDEQRKAWRSKNLNGSMADNILLVTGSAPRACENPSGDHFLLKSLKNKMDYGRLHGIQIFYNLAHISDELSGYWSKLPLLRELMLAHPEIEWLWWMDSDAFITNMEFELPMTRYKDHNLVVPGWEDKVYDQKSWVGLNTGCFFLRNCQWSLDLLDEWAKMGPKGSVRDEAGKIVTNFLTDRPLFEADDQSALIYMLIQQRKTWGDKIYMESRYCLHGYWVPIVELFDDMTKDILHQTGRHSYHGPGDEGKLPFVTHFVGCKPCAKDGDGSYPLASCLTQMERTFNFADNQIWQHYNHFHESLTSSILVHHQATS